MGDSPIRDGPGGTIHLWLNAVLLGRQESSFLIRGDTWTHISSGMEFPERVGGFRRRTAPRFFQATGWDVSVGYATGAREGSSGAALTVRVYPGALRERPVDDSTDLDFADFKNEIEMSCPGAVLLGDEDFGLRADGAWVEGFKMRYRIDNEDPPTLLSAYVIRRGIWVTRYWAAYREDGRNNPEGDVEAAIDALGVPDGVRPRIGVYS